ncbi:glycoside hydrolase family 3 C-terminal domain-containing protein [Sediminispirochaeta smaragdinae]|uniref:Glycoside hydrolase family 3 domain protein n=1 Tax=Sediminispirochaeta smaragdinae (strain DSM 11293 / JCM 15392 / SEBR 4228) TaxID=573413 RepID=E1R2R9_SEDSS|nr:glycoside hydrolase family 3 C-terminal domain-containing protein [Sediminispirochaeta smaragdinae]ADK80351.1 glycoside hydrolase family 3 domain protein [Sediminispirochaeta smaragdinae DSM 11293]
MTGTRAIETILGQMSLDEKLRLCTGDGLWHTAAFPSLGVPAVLMSDGTSGVRLQKESKGPDDTDFAYNAINSSFDSDEALTCTYAATCFPSGSTISCSWDTELIQEVGRAIAEECRALGIRLLLGPGINIRRHPLTARNFEYYSEDPFLTGRMGAAMVKGLAERGVGAVVKHFACHHSDSNRTRVDEICDRRTLHEIYLAAFEYIVKTAHPVGVMSSYNKINGVYASANHWLLTEVLRDRWGFDGFVISDWGGVPDPVAASKAGLDLQMPESLGSKAYLRERILAGELDEAHIDGRVRNILRMVFRLEAMRQEGGQVDTRMHHDLARRAAAESIVLLRNENHVLPLSASCGTIAVIGELALSPLYQGTGCAIVNSRRVDTPLDCIKEQAPAETKVLFSRGYRGAGEDDGGGAGGEDTSMVEEARACAASSDVVVFFLGSFLPPESDHYNREHMRVEASHERVLEAVLSTGKPVVVILQSGDAVEMAWSDRVDALLMTGFGGEGVGDAIARVLFGTVNPSGRLPVTIPKSLRQTPAFTSFPGDGFNLVVGEGIFTGYRYYDYRGLEPLFPFGYGLSYTRFTYGDVKLSSETVRLPECLEIAVEVENSGEFFGKEVVQLYLSQSSPRIPRPVRELKGFAKLSLAPGEKKRACFTLCERDFSYFDESRDGWSADSDAFLIEIGSSSRNIKASVPVRIIAPPKPLRILNAESGFSEILESPISRDMLFEFLIDRGIIARSDVTEALEHALRKSFWGLYSYLDMNGNGKVSLPMVRDLTGTMNRAIEAAAQGAV